MDLGATDDDALAEHLNISKHTVRTEFKRIFELTGAHSRFSAIMLSERNGWIISDQHSTT
jgi:DNA-binding NarL/FixJ family response regulator